MRQGRAKEDLVVRFSPEGRGLVLGRLRRKGQQGARKLVVLPQRVQFELVLPERVQLEFVQYQQFIQQQLVRLWQLVVVQCVELLVLRITTSQPRSVS